MRDFSVVLSTEFELEGLGSKALEGLLRHVHADAGAILIAREEQLEPLASHGIRDTSTLGASDHVRRVIRLDRTEQIAIGTPDVIIDLLLVGQVAREILVAPLTFKSVPLGAVVLAYDRAASSATPWPSSSNCGRTLVWPSTMHSPTTAWSG